MPARLPQAFALSGPSDLLAALGVAGFAALLHAPFRCRLSEALNTLSTLKHHSIFLALTVVWNCLSHGICFILCLPSVEQKFCESKIFIFLIHSCILGA